MKTILLTIVLSSTISGCASISPETQSFLQQAILTKLANPSYSRQQGLAHDEAYTNRQTDLYYKYYAQ